LFSIGFLFILRFTAPLNKTNSKTKDKKKGWVLGRYAKYPLSFLFLSSFSWPFYLSNEDKGKKKEAMENEDMKRKENQGLGQ